MAGSGAPRNIVLIGMPGSGKSSVGALVAEKLGRAHVDMDAYIEEAAGMRIPEIFKARGEAAFRDMEAEAAKALGCRRALVISAGGGTVLRREGMEALRRNGFIIFLDRPISELATDGRPLSQGGGDALRRLYDARIGLYTGYADARVPNGAGVTAAEAAENVLRAYEALCAGRKPLP